MPKSEAESSMSLTVAARRVFDFKVEDYSLAKKMAFGGEYFQSDAFSVGGHDWAVRFRNKYPSTVSLHLAILSKPKHDVGAKFVCRLLDKPGKPAAGVVQKTVCSKFFNRGQENGFSSFISEEDLAKYLHGDCFVVRCTIAVHRKPMS